MCNCTVTEAHVRESCIYFIIKRFYLLFSTVKFKLYRVHSVDEVLCLSLFGILYRVLHVLSSPNSS